MKQPNVFGKMFEGGDQRGNRWTQGGEREGGKEGGPAGKPLDARRGRRRREEGGELTLINTIIKKT
jgi:hypothetical protein